MPKKLKNELLLATNNAGKLKELHQLLTELSGVRLLAPNDLGLWLDVAESGESYAENAALKAAAFSQAADLVVIADDSGLEVDALGGAPGIRSARYAPQPGATDADRRALLLENLSGQPRPWTARFRAWVAIAAPGEVIRSVEGICEGEIIPEERGTNGFGYDPIFWIPSAGRTMAELTDEEKNALSHRGNAVRQAIPLLRKIFNRQGS
ncbi:MAG TPA: non-canonical purine NTP pyrophosphatase, RdgB/HAM1 family [Chloroflexi bacterium]|nr:non-canonical purine NTP pyrophosphatase, RdgB/HAM1 family [Chloroflexota bacterium]